MSLVSYALTTADRFFDFIDKSSPTASETAQAQAIINAITDFVERYTGRRFKKTTYTNELYDGQKNDTLVLKNFPVISGETFSISRRTTSENDDEWDTVESDTYFIDYDAGIVYRALGNKFLHGRRNYRVTYTAGFDFDNVATFASDVGLSDLEMAVWQFASMVWNKKKGDWDVDSERIGDYSISYSGAFLSGIMFRSAGEGGTSYLQTVLDQYQRGDTDIVSVLTPQNT